MPRPLKTLHVTTVDLTAWCFLRSWFSYLRDRGTEVTLACTVESFRDDLEASGAEVLHLPISRRLRPLKDMASLLDLVYLMRRLKPDVVHTYTSKAGFLGRLAARLAGVPLVVHSILELPENSVDRPWAKFAYWSLEFVAARMAHHLVTISEANRRQIVGELIARPNRLTVIRLGLDLEKYRPARPAAEVRRDLGIPEGAPVVGCVARLEPAKGHVFLLEAFVRVLKVHPEARLILVGQGWLREDLEARAARMGLQERVVFTGFRDDMLDLMGAFDVFALASLYEGLGVVLLEAMALRKPVVSSAVGGTTDVVVDGETGWLVPPRDPQPLAEKILDLLAAPERAREFGEAGRRRVEEHFVDAEANRQMMGLYRRLLGKYRPAQLHEVHLGRKGV